ATDAPVWVVLLLSAEGKMVLERSGSEIWCLDSTHNTGYGMTRDEKVFLTTIIVRSQDTGSGFPAAFLLTPSETQLPLAYFLSWVTKLVPAPKDVMVDCSVTEQAAIKITFSSSAQPPRILLCQWHVVRAWEDNIKNKIKFPQLDDEGVARSRQVQERCRKILRDLVYAAQPETFLAQFAEFQREWTMFFPDFMLYFRREWVTKRPPSMWSLAYRQHAHYGIDTNNYVESWHDNLKINYLGLIKKQRIDHVICVLTREFIPDYVRRLVQ
ncbi:unnamed protein product, partial [Tilletia laevis]